MFETKNREICQLAKKTRFTVLEIYYTEVKSKKGTELSKSTFIGLRAGLNRYINEPPYNETIIMTAPVFSTSNRMMASVLNRVKKGGGRITKHKQTVSDMAFLPRVETAYKNCNYLLLS